MQRLLLVCQRCWALAFPLLKQPDTRSVHSYSDCIVCEQARGVIYVRASISFAPNVTDASKQTEGA